MASSLKDAVDRVPVVGHAKGANHCLVGDEIAGEKAMFKILFQDCWCDCWWCWWFYHW